MTSHPAPARRSRRFPLRRAVAGLAAVATAATLAACGSGDPDPTSPPASGASDDPVAQLEAAAKAEGSLTLYSSADEATGQRVAEAFEERYGISINFTRMPSGPLTARYTAEAEAGSVAADVVVMSDKAFIDTAVAKDWMIPLDETAVPNLAELPESIEQHNSAPVGITVTSSLVVNTDAVPDADLPTTWQDLLDPRWKGQLFELDPRALGVWLAAMDVLDQRLGDGYVRDLRAQQSQFVDSMVTGVQLVAAGERAAALGANETHISPLLAEAPDAPVKLVRLDGPQFGFEWVAGVSRASGSPNAGKLFVHWLLSEEGQRTFMQSLGNSIYPDLTIEGFAPLSDDVELLDIAAAQQRRDQLLTLMNLPE